MVLGKVLVVDDEAEIRELCRLNLEFEGFDVVEAPTGPAALRAAKDERPDLIFLTLMMPGMDGFDVLRVLKEDDDTCDIPVILLTAKTDEGDQMRGWEEGILDYVVKPFNPAELVARVQAVMRRLDCSPAPPAVLDFVGLRVDVPGRRVLRGTEEIALTPREFDLLAYLARHEGQAFSREHLMEVVWKYSFYTDTATVTVHMRRLRAKLETDPTRPRWLVTVWGVGYRFQA